MRTRYADVPPYLTKDGSTIRELMHPAVHGNRLQSLAEATIVAGARTQLHRHALTEELYHITAGTGLMTLGDATLEVVAGDTVLPGTTVVVAVSAGPAPRVVPDLTGAAVDAATATLTELGLEIAVLPDEFSDTVPAGGIARQDPVAGTEVPRGATVSVAGTGT